MPCCWQANKLSNHELNMLGEMIGEQVYRALSEAANSDSEHAQSARQELVSMLNDCHGTSRVLSVTRVTVWKDSKRELHTIKLPHPRSIRRLLKSPALWAHVKVRKIVLAIAIPGAIFIRNLKVITPPGGTSIRALSG
ncbi:hypothetical protein ACLK19_00400 [Escherichia coli]